MELHKQQRENHEKWRKNNISSPEEGFQNGNHYPHIIPKKIWKENLWKGIKEQLVCYIGKEIKPHTGVHNLLSSWIVCANVYFSIKTNEQLKLLFLSFLKRNISDTIIEIEEVELEFAFPKGDDLHPEKLLGEIGGDRGTGQTSPDIAFFVKTKTGKGIILCENKFTEHSFYPCSARKIDTKSSREKNPDSKRCLVAANINNCDYRNICHQSVWGRKYLNLITFSNTAKNKLQRCPAATAGYQLLRQQALAEGIAQSGKYELVISAVAFDERNSTLKHCLKSTGINDFQAEWADIFVGKAVFKTWTHQEWIEFVRKNKIGNELDNWLIYLNDRYGY
jgi:hypothetical protein